LDQVVEYFALFRSPIIRKHRLIKRFGERDIKSNLADLYPQITAFSGRAYNIKLSAADHRRSVLITFGQQLQFKCFASGEPDFVIEISFFASKILKILPSATAAVISQRPDQFKWSM